jgi:hypothetical protein
MAGDDGLSASELRAQYARGGTLDDSQLTASQLRARHGIQANTKDFSTKQGESGGVNPVLMGLLALIVVVTLVSQLSGCMLLRNCYSSCGLELEVAAGSAVARFELPPCSLTVCFYSFPRILCLDRLPGIRWSLRQVESRS